MWWPWRQKSAEQIYADAMAKRMTSPVSQDSTIANYQNQTQQIKDMKWVLICAIVAGTLLMMISVLAPFIIVGFIDGSLGNSINKNANQTGILNTIDKLTSTPGAVLPLATGLVGFAGGVVTAMFRTSTTAPDKIPPGEAPPSQAPPHAIAKGPDQPVSGGSLVTLDGTGSHDSTGGSSKVSYFWVQTAGDPVTLTGANTAKLTFTAPTKATNLSFILIVADSTGAFSSPATVSVSVT